MTNTPVASETTKAEIIIDGSEIHSGDWLKAKAEIEPKIQILPDFIRKHILKLCESSYYTGRIDQAKDAINRLE